MPVLSKEATDVLTVARELKILDDASIKMLQQLFSNRVDQDLIQQLVVGRETELARTLFKLITATHAAGTLGYVMRFLADLGQQCPSLIQQFARNDAEQLFGQDPALTFAAICDDHRQTAGVFNPAVYLFASTLAHTVKTNDGQARPDLAAKFMNIAAAFLGAAEITQSGLEYALHAICEFLRCTKHRTMFREAGLVPQIPRLLTLAVADNSPSVVQLTYEILLAARLLSYDYECLVELHAAKAIPTVHRALQKASKEKVTRMALYVLRNFLDAQAAFHDMQKGQESKAGVLTLAKCNRGKGPRFYADLIGVGALKTAKQLQKKKFGDDDVPAQLDNMVEVLQANFDELSGVAEYKGELDSGVLEWSPAHTSSRFWKENCKAFEANEYEMLRALAQLLSSPSSSELTVAIACHDVGELVRNHPSGRQLLDIEPAKHVKERLMALMSHESPDVAKAALTAVQKVLVDRF
jgi:V-type H+-transporting ATPase subunit H